MSESLKIDDRGVRSKRKVGGGEGKGGENVGCQTSENLQNGQKKEEEEEQEEEKKELKGVEIV